MQDQEISSMYMYFVEYGYIPEIIKNSFRQARYGSYSCVQFSLMEQTNNNNDNNNKYTNLDKLYLYFKKMKEKITLLPLSLNLFSDRLNSQIIKFGEIFDLKKDINKNNEKDKKYTYVDTTNISNINYNMIHDILLHNDLLVTNKFDTLNDIMIKQS